MSGEKTHRVTKLESGTVLDHLRAGTALRTMRVLKIPEGHTVTVGINLRSERHGRKDLIKIDSYELTAEEAAKIALLSPDATLSIIRGFEIVQKYDLQPPVAFRGLILCPNPACIVHEERVPGSFMVVGRDPVAVRCDYCERTIDVDQFDFL